MAVTDEQIQQRVRKALRIFGDVSKFEDVIEGLRTGKYQIFQNDHGVCITQIKEGNGRRYLYLFICAGELPGVMDLLPVVTDFARLNGCKWLESCSRLGFEKVMIGHGFKKKAIIFVKEV
jgi:hypothetical protein